MQIPYSKRTLSNGLDVIVHEDHQLPMVAVNIWYHVGSKNERPGRTGFAHLFEHLMFEGSEHHDHGYFPPLQRAGGLLNGSTNVDRTNYWEVVPTGALDLALWMESDRMGYLLPALTEQKFNNQRDVVLNERRQNYENRPYGLAGIALSAAMFPPDHPYHWPTIGSADDLRAATLDRRARVLPDLLPPGQRVAVAGRRHRNRRRPSSSPRSISASLPPGPAVERVRVDARLTESANLVLEDRVELPRLYISWHSPAMFAADDAELDIVADVLAHGKTSRLYKIARLRAPRRHRRVGVSAFARNGRHVPDRLHGRGGRRAAGIEHRRSSARSPSWPATARPPPRSSAASRRPKRSSSTGCRPSAASAARAIS